MGKGSSGSTTTSTNSSAPPADVMAQYDALIAQANTQAQQPLQQYQGNIVAPLTDQQNQAGAEVANAQGASQPLYNQAQGLIQQSSQPIVPQTVNAADIQQYQNPYTQQVINSTMANIQQQQSGQQSQLAGNAASSGAFGGDRQAVAQALLANQQDLANNQTIAGLENQSYSQALGEANTQQQAGLSAQEASQYLGQQGASGLTNLGNTEQNAALTGAAALNSMGAQEQAQNQAQLNVPYEQFQQAQAFPYQNLSWLSSLSTGLGSNMGGTSTSSTTQPAPNSLFGFNRGGHVDGLIKRLASGGAVMMPAHYDSGGIIPGQGYDAIQQSGIPNLDPNIFNGDPMSLTRGNGIPGVQRASEIQQPSAMQQAEGAVGLANGLNGLAGGGKGGTGGISGMLPSMGSVGSFFGGGSNTIANPTSGISANPLNLSSGSDFSSSDLASIGSDFGSGTAQTASSSGISSLFSSLGDMFFAKGGAVPSKYAFGGNVLPDVVSGIGDVVGAFFGDPMAGSQATGVLSELDGGETKPGLQLSMLNRGGLVRHYDGGGLVPSDTSANPMTNNMSSQYAAMSAEQLEQLLPRVQQPQVKQIIQKVLQQKQVMPNMGNVSNATPSAPSAPQAAMATGGLIKGYADGSDVPLMSDSDAQKIKDSYGNENDTANSIVSNTPSIGLIKSDPSVTSTQPVHLSSDDTMPNSSAGLTKSTPATGSNGFTPIPLPSFHDDKPINEVSPWLSVLAGVAGAAAGKSPYLMQNLAGGLESGLTNYGQQKKEAADETYKTGTIQDARDQMIREAQQFNATGQKQADQFTENLSLDQQKADQLAKYQQGELANSTAQRNNQQQEMALKKIEAYKPIFDKAGNPWQLDPETGSYKKISGSQLGSNQNIYGYEIGSVPAGTSSPVIDPKYDPTLGMDMTRKSINSQKTQDQLEKDNAAAAVNNDSIARLQAAKNVITTAPTGGVTNLLGIGPIADAFSTQRQELSALNKELAMAPGERPTNMRLTQGEVMMLKQAQPGNDKSPEANADIADANIAIRTRPQEFANFKNDFVANNGYWNDAIGQQMYNKYITDNPIIDIAKSGNGKIVLNPNRQTIEQYANNGGFSKYGVTGNPQSSTTTGAKTSSAQPVIHPAGLPSGSLYSPSRNQYKAPDGTVYDAKGNPVNG